MEDSNNPLQQIGSGEERPDPLVYQVIATRTKASQPVALVTIVGQQGSAPRGMGAAMAVLPDGTVTGTVGGGEVEQRLIRDAVTCLADGRPRQLRYDTTHGPDRNLGAECHGVVEAYIQPFCPAPEVVIAGAGHVGIATARAATLAGYRVTVIDDRQGFPDPSRFPPDARCLSGPFIETLEGLSFIPATHVVIVTHEHTHDESVLRHCLRRPWRYLGMIGSAPKVRGTFERIRADASSELSARLEDVRAPIGLDLGGRSPGEIGIAIVAEMQTVRYGRRGDPLRQ